MSNDQVLDFKHSSPEVGSFVGRTGAYNFPVRVVCKCSLKFGPLAMCVCEFDIESATLSFLPRLEVTWQRFRALSCVVTAFLFFWTSFFVLFLPRSLLSCGKGQHLSTRTTAVKAAALNGSCRG